LKALQHCATRLGCFWPNFVLRMLANCCFRAAIDTIVGYGNPDFLYGTDILVIGGH